ncbi:MAG TPA: FAD-dependent oxidoreductase [Candidatus Dorea intestinavium]|nr:FAD-dependent oxidoreductase [Candidatus Dorea intestinavium]
MIIINQLKLPIQAESSDLKKKILKTLRLRPEELLTYEITKRSIDARHKKDIYYVYSVQVFLKEEKKVRQVKDKNILYHQSPQSYQFGISGKKELAQPPVIIGSGPAGLFLTYQLALMGYRPLLIEQGKPVLERQKDVEKFWQEGLLNPYSNVQFGEGGAGTFSDGKLNTSVKDPLARGKYILKTFVKFGAPEEILFDNKPHIGTDILSQVVSNMSKEIRALGGTILFSHCLEDIIVEENQLKALKVIDLKSQKELVIKTEIAALCVGHSARNLFASLYAKGVSMEQKAFAVGLRVMHPQDLINEAAYGPIYKDQLPSAPYKVTAKTENGKGVYSFCMCPGGYVVNASSEEGHLAINGMSYHERDNYYANSAIVITVNSQDFESTHPLAGIKFQRNLEKNAWKLGKGKIPTQLYGDFKNNVPTKTLNIKTGVKGAYAGTNLRALFSDSLNTSFITGMETFAKKIKGFADDSTLLLGVESRTSSPVRITRDEEGESNYKGLYPCGEGAGYAGGIMSAAMDGLKLSELIAKKYQV